MSVDIAGDEANALAKEIYDTLCSVTYRLTPICFEGYQTRDSVIRNIRKLEEFLDVPADDRLNASVGVTS